MGGVRDVSSITRSPMVPVVELVLRRSVFHEEAPGCRWLAVREACRTRALCFELRAPDAPQESGCLIAVCDVDAEEMVGWIRFVWRVPMALV